jgi:tetratricopeptide (TPR) repeat protein/CHAT domain-containing protein
LAIFSLALTGSPSLSGQTADPPAPLSAQERQKLEARASELNQTAWQAYQRGDLVAGIAGMMECLEIREALYPKDRYRQGNPDLAESLSAMGFLLRARGSYGEARKYHERALAMDQSLYPKDRYPLGHPDLARSLNNLGSLLQAQGSYAEAREYLERALAMHQSLYTEDRYPQGHPELANSLNNLGGLLQDQGLFAEARAYLERALVMRQSLYSKDRYPQGHPELANSLNNLGGALQLQGSYREARGCFERALAMRRSLYQNERYPHGHPDLAASLSNMGLLLRDQGSYAEARGYMGRSLAMRRSLYPEERYPHGHPALAVGLNNMGLLLEAQGSYGEARGYFERALAMNQSLYPKEEYPHGHPHVAASLNSLASLLQDQGSYVEARAYYERALAMNERLYPGDHYPQGQPDVARSLNNLGHLLMVQGLYGDARAYLERALAMYQSLYTKERYPEGHPDLANILNNLGSLLEAEGSYGEARRYCERGLAMRDLLYPRGRYPLGHPELATSLTAMGFLLHAQGSYVEARAYYERALAMNERLYPGDRYPQGHPGLARSLNDLSALFLAQGSYAEAADYLGQATDMQHALARTLLAATSEAEAMNYLAELPLARDALISVSLRVPGSDGETYRRIWNGKSALTQILHDRHAAMLVRAGKNPVLGQIVTDWRDARSRLARLILSTADGRDHPERVALIQALSGDKERLERKLAAAVPEFARKQALEQSRHEDLLKVLHEGKAVLDLLRFIRFERDPDVKGKNGERRKPSYVGFLLSKGRPVRMVDLGPAEPIERAISQWRQAAIGVQDSPAAAVLRRLLWEPLARHLPKGTTTVYVAPDGPLCYIPWAALPGDRPGKVLLEQYALAIVPHVPFLLDRLSAPSSPGHDRGSGILLAVGGVAYGQEPKPVDDERTRLQLLVARPAEPKRGEASGWPDLPGTLQELDDVSRLAASRAIIRVKGAEAGTARLLQELPRARWAHIAAHGFFADPSVQSVPTPHPTLFTEIGRERIGAGLRNPLVLSGLVLAGANRPRSEDDLLAHDDRGILTAEAIAGLDLSGMELAVLSACETGIGLGFGGGEGVFGLQRAFHLAGAHNVIASLWKVDDQATAALMALFYEKLWRQRKPPLEALREAQLALYRRPELVGKLAAARGTPDFDKLVRLPEPVLASDGSPTPRCAPARQWAAFVLSGDGR